MFFIVAVIVVIVLVARSRKARAAKRPGLMARRPGAGSETTTAQARDSRPDLGLRGWSG
jgi:hypothetical protein